MRRANVLAAAAPKESTPAPARPPLRKVAAPPAPPEIDPTSRDARKQLEARYPRVERDAAAPAPPGADRWATVYLRANAEIAKLEAEKEIAGNHLRAAIGPYRGIEGAGFAATWSERAGDVDWPAVAKAHGISEESIQKFRRPSGRTLRVVGKG